MSDIPNITHYQNEELNQGFVYTFDTKFLETNFDDKLLPDSFNNIKKIITLKIKHQFSKQIEDLDIKNQTEIEEENFEKFEDIEVEAINFIKWIKKQYDLDEENIKEDLGLNNLTTETTIKIQIGKISGDYYDKNIEEKKISVIYKEGSLDELQNKYYDYFCRDLAKIVDTTARKIERMFIYLFTSKDDLQYRKENIFLYDFKMVGNENKKKQAYFYIYLLKTRKLWSERLDNYIKNQEKNFYQKNAETIQNIENVNFYFPKEIKYQYVLKNNWLEIENLKMQKPNKVLYQDFLDIDVFNFSSMQKTFITNFLEKKFNIKWWFWNTKNKKQSWKINFLNQKQMIETFYPTFIACDNHEKIYIFEIFKNDDFDNKHKFLAMKKFLPTKITFEFINIKNDQIFFLKNDDEWNDDFNNWKKIS